MKSVLTMRKIFRLFFYDCYTTNCTPPTGNLDSKTSREILDILKFTNQKYKQTILLVTHDEKIALQANRIITIGDGKIIKDEVMK